MAPTPTVTVREYGPKDTPFDDDASGPGTYNVPSLGLTTSRTTVRRDDGWYAVWTETRS